MAQQAAIHLTRTFIPKAAIKSICSGRSSDLLLPCGLPTPVVIGTVAVVAGALDEAYSIG